MKLEACRAIAHLLLDRKGGTKGRKPPSHAPAGGGEGEEERKKRKARGRLYRSEPDLGRQNHSHIEPQTPLNNNHHHHHHHHQNKSHNSKKDNPHNDKNHSKTPNTHKTKYNNSQDTQKRSSHHNHHHQGPLNNSARQGVCVNDGPPPPLPAHPPPPPPVPPHAQPLLPQPPQQPLPPVPGQEEVWRDAPGTCTLPRRGLVRDEMARYRSPSNPPPASRQPPPYSRHQPPPPQSRPRGPYLHPPPPKGDLRDHRASRNLEDMLDVPRNGRDREDPAHLREGWERRHEAWLPHHRWSTRQPDSGFDSMSVPMAGEDGSRSRVDSPDVRHEDEEQYQSSEDLARNSRASPLSLSSVSSSSSPHYPTVRASKQPCLTPTTHAHNPPHPGPRPSPLSPSASSSGLGPPHHHSTPVGPSLQSESPEGALLSADSVYPQPGPQPPQSLADQQPRYAEIQEAAGDRVGGGDSRLHHRLSCDIRDLTETRDNCPPRHSTSARRYRDTSLPRDFRDIRIPRAYPDPREERLGGREGLGGRELEDEGDRRGQRPLTEAGKEARFSGGDASEGLRVRDAPSSESRQWGGDGADGGTARVGDQRRGDGCNAASSSSVSWMEWTQQLQAYVAWVNSQLRKRGGPLITDLRRDLQSGIVFADLIEIISGERVAGVTRGEDSTSPQVSRDNLERVLSFMAAKRIRMTHITSKEVAEGNLKSIMRVILALAAHYKPQSVKAVPPPPPPPDPSPPLPHPHHYPAATHDIGVGPDTPAAAAVAAPDKTPNLSTNRRVLVEGSDDIGAAGLRRHPSMTAAAPPRDSSPVYENLPRRVAPHRWAYDSLRASHKFQWSGQSQQSQQQQQQQQRLPGTAITGPPSSLSSSGPAGGRTNLDESSDDPLNHTLNTSSLNTSLEVDVETSPRRTCSRPAALNFWQDLITTTQQSPPPVHAKSSRQDHHHHHTPQSESQSHPLNSQQQHPQDDSSNPFRYHTIHRMSGRRKLPQIPGAAASATGGGGGGQTGGGTSSSSSRGTTPQQEHHHHHHHHSLEDKSSFSSSSSGGGGGGAGGDEGSSREPEGRSQNSSPAASLVRGSSLEPWESEDLKMVLRDLNSTREQLMALHTLELDGGGGGGTRGGGGVAGQRTSDLLDTKATSHGGSPVKQELLHLSLARQALIAEKDELTRLLEHRESVITELRQQVQHRDRTIHAQRAHLDDALRQVHSGKRGGGVAVRGESPGGRNSNSSSGQGQGQREDVQLVRDAIMSLRGNFRETDPTQHTIDTLEQAIAVLLERSSCGNGGSGGGSGGLHTAVDKSPRCSSTDKRTQLSGGGGGGGENWTKVIYFTERTVTPFMSTVGRRLGEVTLRDFKAMFDRPGTYRFHFKSNDPEYGMVKEEVMNDDDILPGVDGKIIAWVEENTD